MNENNDRKTATKPNYALIAVFVISFLVFLSLWLPRPDNLKQLGIAFLVYSEDTGNYPTLENWCDLIKVYLGKGNEIILRCPEAKRAECNYAMNPYCEPNSPSDTVLLFETNGGWNLSGGPELLTTENHKKKICNVLFNDYTVKSIKEDEIKNLKWNAEINSER